jgi:hypothetical protein
MYVIADDGRLERGLPASEASPHRREGGSTRGLTMKIAAALIASALASATLGLSPAQAQQCPPGAFPSVDNWGNQTCKRFSDQSTATTQVPRGQQCPTGAIPAVDNFGNPICRSIAAPNQPRTDYYDTSRGCPVGTLPSVDMYGNQVCKRL